MRLFLKIVGVLRQLADEPLPYLPWLGPLRPVRPLA